MEVKFEEYTTDRICKCKICNEEIPKNIEHIKFGEIYVAGNFINIHFHHKCLAESYDAFLETLKK